MNLIHLKYFMKLAELEHYTRAAKELNITQPSLSHAISTLENSISVKLFEKKGRNVILTKSGKIFYNIIKISIDNIDDAVNYIQKIQQGDGLINIGFSPEVGIATIPLLCREFKNNNLETSVTFNFFNSLDEKLISGLENNEFDIAFTTNKIENSKIKYIPFAKQNMILAVASENELSKNKEISLSDITNEKFISLSNKNPITLIANKLFEENNFSPNIEFSLNNENNVAGLVSQNFGVAILPDNPLLDSLNISKVKLTELTQDRLLYIAYLEEESNIPLIYNFINFVKNYKFNNYLSNYKEH